MKVIYAFSIALSVLFISCNDELKHAREENNKLRDSLVHVSSTLDSLIKTDFMNISTSYWTESNPQFITLKRRGVHDASTYIANDLTKRSDLIPFKPVLGGTMMFSRVLLLGANWAVASFEDGHIGGYLLLRYQVQSDNTIRWQVLDKHLSD